MSLEIMDLQQGYGNFFTPSFQILVDQQDLLVVHHMEIVSVQVENTLKGMDRFSFTVNSTFNFESREFTAATVPGVAPNRRVDHLRDTFAFGKPVEIYMGYVGARPLRLMLRGMITSVQTSFPSAGLPQINVSGYDLSYPMSKGKTDKSWENKTDTYVVQEIAGKYGLKVTAEDTRVEHPKREKSQESDFQMIEKLAERNGFETYVYDQELFFRAPQYKAAAVVALEWGKAGELCS